MSTSPDYQVSFGTEAWTINYRDLAGGCVLTFDCDIDEYDSKGSTKKVFLSSIPAGVTTTAHTIDSSGADMRRALIVQRVQEYLVSLGYDVHIVKA